MMNNKGILLLRCFMESLLFQCATDVDAQFIYLKFLCFKMFRVFLYKNSFILFLISLLIENKIESTYNSSKILFIYNLFGNLE